MARATFSLDDETIAEIKRTAIRLKRSQSHVLREAVAEYAARTDRLSERERLRMLGAIKELRAAGPTGTARDTTAELAEIRAARRGGGRRSVTGVEDAE